VTVIAARPDVLDHNMETVPRLYQQVRPGARYGQSLELLASSANRSRDYDQVRLMPRPGRRRE